MSSDDETADSSSDKSEEIKLTGLVATRAKRETAGNLYESLRAHLDDEDIQQVLLAEDEEDDAEDYDGFDVYASDESDAFGSSSDDDEGPPQAGDAEDLDGEKELLKAERAAKSKKRKAQAAKLVVPAFKKVKLADQVTADDGSISPIEGVPKKKKKKPVRVSHDGPSRQSIRSSAIANREVTQANLEENAARAKKQRDTLEKTTKRERANRRLELTLEQRLDKCRRIEKETAKELGRFEREEAERVRLREEALMAKRRKAIDGPVIRSLTTSGCYENGKLKIKRLLHGSQALDNVAVAEPADEAMEAVTAAGSNPASFEGEQPAPSASVVLVPSTTGAAAVLSAPSNAASDALGESTSKQADSTGENKSMLDVEMMEVSTTQIDAPEQPQTTSALPPRPSKLLSMYFPSSPMITALLNSDSSAPGSNSTSTVPRPAEPAVPVMREQAQRTLLILDSFDMLDNATTKRSKTAPSFEPTPIAQLLMPDSYPGFTDEQALYLRKPKKQKAADVALKSSCALTTWPGKYRDPRSGVVFADVAAYKMLQRMIAGGFAWNSMLECWVGPAYGSMGRPARGVPVGFDKPVEASVETVKLESQ